MWKNIFVKRRDRKHEKNMMVEKAMQESGGLAKAEAVNAEMLDTDEILRQHKAVAATMPPLGTEYHEPDFPVGARFFLFQVSEKDYAITPEHVRLTEDVNVSVDPKNGQLYLNTHYYYNDPRMTKQDRIENIDYDGLKTLIASSSDPRAVFFNGMNAKNWRDYVGRCYRQNREQARQPVQIKLSDLLESPKAIEAFYLFYMPPAIISYFRKVSDNWCLFRFYTTKYQRFEKSIYAPIFGSNGEDAVNDLKQTASAEDCWYERVLTPLEVRYFLSQLQLNGLYEKTRSEQMPECQPKYLSSSSHSEANGKRFQNVQAWYVLNDKRYYLQDYATHALVGKSFDYTLEQICRRVIFGCELSDSPTNP